MVKNGGFYIYMSERILTHNVNCHWSDSFLSRGYTTRCSKSYFAAGLTLGSYEAGLFPAEFPGIIVALNVGFDLSLSIFISPAGGRPRRSNDEFVLEWIFFTVSECVNVKSCMLNVPIKWIIFMLSFRALFSIEFYFGRLRQITAIKKNVQLLPISSISRSSLFCFGFDLNQSQGTKPISRNGNGPEWLIECLRYTQLLISLRAKCTSIG